MEGNRAELFVVWVMRLMAIGFLLAGISFILDPDGTILRIAATGKGLGEFADAPPTADKLWLCLSFAYMMVIAVLAWIVQKDVAENRQLILVLFLAKAASSLAALYFFLFDANVFVYLTNFVVDGSLAIVALVCWVLAGRVAPRAS
jgi:hypothetical protein